MHPEAGRKPSKQGRAQVCQHLLPESCLKSVSNSQKRQHVAKCSIRKEFPSTTSYLKRTCYHQAFWKEQDLCKYEVFILETQNIVHVNFGLGGCNTKPLSALPCR